MFCSNTVKWLYENQEDFTWNCGRTIPSDQEFKDALGKTWLILKANGDIIVPKLYAWDGCSPKFCFLDLLVGTPDGAVHVLTRKPKTYYASLVHDALYQFLDQDLPFTRKEVDGFFLRLMEETGFFWRHVYYIAVRLFGGMARWYDVNYGKKIPIQKPKP